MSIEQALDRGLIRARAEAATGGPWVVGSSTHGGTSIVRPADGLPTIQDVWVADSDTERGDALFIAHSREDIPALLDLVDELIADRDEWRRKFSECHSIHLDGVIRASDAEAEDARLSQFPDMRALEQAIAGRTVPTAARAVLALLPTPSAGANGSAS